MESFGICCFDIFSFALSCLGSVHFIWCCTCMGAAGPFSLNLGRVRDPFSSLIIFFHALSNGVFRIAFRCVFLTPSGHLSFRMLVLGFAAHISHDFEVLLAI